MITVPEVVEKIIKHSPFLSEAIEKNLINYSSLARMLKPEVEKTLIKPVSEAAILMALRRLSYEVNQNFTYKNIFVNPPDIIVRSNLVEFTFQNTETLRKKYQKFLERYLGETKYFFTLTEGVFETNIIVSKELEENLYHQVQGEKIISKISHLASITIHLPKENIRTPGVYYFLLKPLAWEGINLVEVISTPMEISIILDNKDVNRAFMILKEVLEK